MQIALKTRCCSVINPPRRITEALRDRVKDELLRLEENGIIQRVAEPTDCVNSMHAVEKPETGKLRTVLDPKALNENIRRPHSQMQTPDDVISCLTDAKFFSTLDVTHAYWNVKLDLESSCLMTFSSPGGAFLRLPFGIKSSQDIFQQKMDSIFESLTGVTSIVDDLLVYGRTKQEHGQNLRQVLERARNKGVRFNLDTVKWGLAWLRYLSFGTASLPLVCNLILTKYASLWRSTSRQSHSARKHTWDRELSAKIPYEWIESDSEFIWDRPQTHTLEKMKQAITQQPVLSYFDPKKPVRLECDSSEYGTGAALLQDGRPVTFV